MCLRPLSLHAVKKTFEKCWRADSEFQHVTAYLKDVELKLRESGAGDKEIVEFQARVQNHYVNHIKGKFKDFEFYTGSSERADGMYVLIHSASFPSTTLMSKQDYD